MRIRISAALMLEDMGLVPTLRWLAERATVRVDGAHVDVHISGERRHLSPDIALGLFRIAQESFNNVRKYSRSSAVKAALKFG